MFNKTALRLAAATTLLVGGSLAHSPVFAAAATATTQIFGVADSSNLLTFSNHSYLLDASTPNLTGFDVGSAPANQILSEASGGSASLAEASLDGTGLPTASAQAQGNGAGHATSQWSFDWTAIDSGTVNLSVEYLTSAIVANLGLGDSATAKSYLLVSLDGTSTSVDLLNYYNNLVGDFTDVNFLSLSFNVSSGDSGTLTITAQSDATTVPVPATLWLIGAACPGMLAAVRRRAVKLA